MGGAQQLFVIGALAAFEARCERVRALEQTVPKVDLAIAFLEASLPARVRFACRHCSSFQENLNSLTGEVFRAGIFIVINAGVFQCAAPRDNRSGPAL